MRIRTIALLASLFALMPQIASADELFGVWETSGGRSRVDVTPCGKYVCANITWLKVAVNAAGEPLFDRRNEAAELRDRPIMGILILKVGKTGQNLWKGRVYDPERGKTYPAEVSLLRSDTLQVTGCGLGGLVCKSKNWTKIGELSDEPQEIIAGAGQAPAEKPPAPRAAAPRPAAPPAPRSTYSNDSGLKPYPPR